MSNGTTSLTTLQLLALTRPSNSTVPPVGFVAVSAEKLVLSGQATDLRIDYKAFFNATTNELIITGTPKSQKIGSSGMPGEDISKLPDAGIFFDAARTNTGSNAGAFLGRPISAAQTEDLITQLRMLCTSRQRNCVCERVDPVRK